MLPDIATEASFTLDLSGEMFGLDTTYSIILKDEKYLFYVVAILNSHIIEWYIKQKFQTLGNSNRYKTFLVNVLPIYNPKNVQPTLYKEITSLSKDLFENYNHEKEEQLNDLIKKLYQFDDDDYSLILSELAG